VYKLTLPATMRGVHPVFHVLILWKHNRDRFAGRHRPPLPPITVNGEKEWEVSKILDCRRKGQHLEYLVSWEGYGREEDLWESEPQLVNCRKLVDKFNKNHPDAASRHKRKRRRKWEGKLFPQGVF
jgi:hypothetical protein